MMSVWLRTKLLPVLMIALSTAALAQDKPAEKPRELPNKPIDVPAPEPTAKPAEKAPKEKTEEQKQAEQKAAEELKEGIGNALKQLFPGIAPPAQPVPRRVAPRRVPVAPAQPINPMNGGANTDPKKKPLDAIDKLAPVDPQMQEDWQKIVRRSEKGDWQAVIQAIDKLFEQGRDDGLTLKDDGRLVSVRREAMRLIRQAPADVRDTWERSQLAAAEKLFEAALNSGDANQLVSVATRYFGLAPGFEAADRLVSLHMDRGEHGVALDWIQELWAAKAPLTRDRSWQRKALVVARVSGTNDLAKELEAAFVGQDHDNSAGRATRIGSPDDELARIKRVIPKHEVTPEVLDDWPMLFGSANRLAMSKGSDPVAMQRWQLPMTGSQILQRRIEALTEYLAERGKPAVPTTMPLLINGRIIFRSIEGIEVVDAQTGRLVWSLHETPSVGDDAFWAQRGMAAPKLETSLTFNPNDQTGGPLATLLYSNSARSVLSSDGIRLFVVEDDPLVTMFETSRNMMWNMRGNANSNNRLGTNVLKALDLETGRTLWQAGGPLMNEDVSLALAGHFLLGAPVVDGEDLFVVGQKQNEVRLFVLDPRTGDLKWSQLLAFSELPIERDLQRRMWSVQVAVSGSVIICPTTVGWMVAVDRTRHSILWAQRYSKAGSVPENPNQPNRVFFGGNQVFATSNEALASRWAVSAPVIAGNRLFFTAIENKGTPDVTGVVVSFDLFTGRKLWEKQRGTLQYLAGALSDRLVFVGLDSLKAVSFDGNDLWTQRLPADQGRISGRGVIVGNHLYQPMQRGALLKIGLTDGQVASTLKLNAGRRPLGNLAMYRGLMISLHPSQVMAFEQQDSVTERLAQLQQKPERSLDDRVFEAKLALADGKFENALAVLRPAPNEYPDRDAQQRYEAVLRDALIRQLSKVDTPANDLDEELRRISRTPSQQFSVADLEIRRALAADQHLEAMRRLLVELKNLPSGEFDTALDRNVGMTSRAWAQNLIREIWYLTPSAKQPALTEEFVRVVREAVSLPLGPESEFIAECLKFHSASVPLVQNFARQAESDGRLRDAEHWIEVLYERSATPSLKAAQAIRLARLRANAGDVRGAQAALDRLAKESLALKLPNGETLEKLLAATRAEIAKKSSNDAPAYSIEKVELQRFPMNYSSQLLKGIEPQCRKPSYYEQLRTVAMFENNTNCAERLMFHDSNTGKLLWNVPLRTKQTQQTPSMMRLTGNVLVVLNGNALHALSLPDRRVLWAVPVETAENIFNGIDEFDGGPMTAEEGDYNLQRNEALVGYELFLKRLKGLSRFRQVPTAPVTLIANDDYVAYRVRETLYVYDARTGTFRWKLDRIPSKTTISGTESLLFAIDTATNTATAYRPLSGRKLATPPYAPKLANTLYTDGDLAVVALPQLASGAKGLSIEAIETRSGKIAWRHDFSATVRVGRLADDELVLFEPIGDTSILSLWDGQLTKCDNIPANVRLSRTTQFAFRDRERVYLQLSSQSQQWIYGELGILPVNGPLLAFDRSTGKKQWDVDVSNHNLLLSDVTASPVLISLHRAPTAPFNGFGNEFKLLVLDKKTGKRAFDQTETLNDFNFRSVLWNHEAQHIDMLTYNLRLRLKTKMKEQSPLIPLPEDR